MIINIIPVLIFIITSTHIAVYYSEGKLLIRSTVGRI